MLKKILALVLMLCATLAMAAVDVNKATDAQLDSVKGIGPATSKAIVTERKKGDFKDWADFISRVKGIGDKKAEALSKEGLTVNGEAYKSAAAKTDGKKDTQAAAKDEKKDTKAAAAKDDKKNAKADSSKTAASGAKADASKPAASAKK